MSTLRIRLLTGLLCIFGFNQLAANNVQIGNVSLSGNNLSFNISWNNSWRSNSTAPYNYDAVWVFVKYRDCATNQWFHADLDSAASGTPLQADTTSDQKGVMVHRASDGVGNITNVAVTVRLSGLPSGNFDFKIFGVEMVYLPQAAFSLGDGISTYSFRLGNQTTVPYPVVSENAITFGNSGSNLYAGSYITTGTLPAAFPKGFGAVYMMKYEISQDQYAEFLNTLTSAQVTSRYLVSTANRYTLTGVWPSITTTSGNRACSYLNWDDLTAYLDWAALRPMTELEFEKSARGTATFVPGEYVWGTGIITDANTLVNDGTPSESVSNPVALGSGIASFNNTTVLGPLRSGFHGSATSNRLQIGAGYYGVCELSGNVTERVVSAGIASGRSFTDVYGDGSLTSTGFSNVATWPTAAGSGYRGGSWIDAAIRLRTSDRYRGYYNNNTRYTYNGGRGVRR